MKKVVLLLASLAAFVFIAAPIYMKMEAHPLVANGKPFGSAKLINGVWAIPLEDFARLGGSNVSLEPNFKLQGNTLIGLLLPAVNSAYKGKIEASAAANTIGGIAVDKSSANKIMSPAEDKHKVGLGGGLFRVTRNGGVISRNIFMFEGKAWIPLADVARAFGGTFTAPAGNLQPGQSLSLNFTRSAIGGAGGVLAMNQ